MRAGGERESLTGQSRGVLAVVAPGQGAQTPGFLAPWLEVPAASDRLAWLSAVTGLDLAHLGTEADAETIRDTKIAQPLLVAAGLLAAGELPWRPDQLEGCVLSGHSVGELTAAALAGVLSPEQALVLVRERGLAMADAAARTPTGMSAVLGGDPDEVRATIGRHGLTAANDNGPGQVVAAGTMEQLAALAEEPPTKARVVGLQVAGAFHTEHMRPAVGRLESLARGIAPRPAAVPLLSNRDGRSVTDGDDVLGRMVGQIANPVRWDLCMQTMLELGVTGVLELPPAGTLTGIARRAMKGVETLAWKSPDQLEEVVAFCAAHARVAETLQDGPR